MRERLAWEEEEDKDITALGRSSCSYLQQNKVTPCERHSHNCRQAVEIHREGRYSLSFPQNSCTLAKIVQPERSLPANICICFYNSKSNGNELSPRITNEIQRALSAYRIQILTLPRSYIQSQAKRHQALVS